MSGKRKQIYVLLCVTQGSTVDVNFSFLLEELSKEFMFQREYLSLVDDLSTIRENHFDLVLVDLNPCLRGEVQRVYDYFSSRDLGVRLLGYGCGWPRDTQQDWPEKQFRFNYMESLASGCQKIRRLLSK